MFKKIHIAEAKTEEEAIEICLKELFASSEHVNVEIIQKSEKKMFGLKSVCARVKVSLREDEIQRRNKQEEKLIEEKTQEKRRQEELKLKEQERVKQEQEEYEKFIKEEILDYSKNFPDFLYTAFISVLKIMELLEKNHNVINFEDVCEDVLYVFHQLRNNEGILSANTLENVEQSYKYLFSKYTKNKYRDINGFVEVLSKNAENTNQSKGVALTRMLYILSGNSDGLIVISEDARLELENNDDIINEANCNLHLFSNYFEAILTIYIMGKTYKYLAYIYNNEELCQIIKNGTMGEININGYDKLYRVYNEFYSNVFPHLLTSSEFSAVVSVFVLAEGKHIDLNIINTTLNLLELNGEDLVKNMMSDKPEEMSPYFYILNSYLEKGTFDKLFQSEEKETIVLYLVFSINYEIMKSYSLENSFFELYESYMVAQKAEVYYTKYSLLNCSKEKVDGIVKLRESLKNAVTGIDFEMVLYDMYILMGYQVETTKVSGDQGADLIISKNGIKSVVQAKFYTGSVGNGSVQEVIGALGYYKATKGVVVTNSVFTKSAVELANANDIQLIDGNVLETCINAII